MQSSLDQEFSKLTLSDNDDKEFAESVARYPSSFDLKLDGLTKPRVRDIWNTLIGKLDNGFVTTHEEIQVYNLPSYLSFILEDIDAAVHYNDIALSKDRRNGIALANRARYNRHQFNFSDAEEDLKQLESLYSNDNAKTITRAVAEGELAQSYARFGPKFHESAIQKYETLLQGNPRVNHEILILWQYDYCLTLRRTLNIFNKQEYPDRDRSKTLKKTCLLLSKIIDTSSLKTYIARAWIELGQLVYNAEQNPLTFENCKLFEIIPVQKQQFSNEKYFKIGLEIDDDDFDVLEACAKFYRYLDKPDIAIRLFEHALKRRQTSLCYHHLALSIRKIELGKVNAQKNQRKNRQQRYSGYGRGGRQSTKTPQKREQSSLKRAIKCGRKATQLPFNEETKTILINLEKAVELHPGNHFAAYDKAFLFRQLQMTKEAKVEFCKLVNRMEIGELMISCFEQAGYCCLDLAKTVTNDSKKYEKDAIYFFQRAIEVAAAMAVKVKYTSLNVRPLVPTVKEMLTNPDLIEAHDVHMQRLQDLLMQNKQLLPVAREANTSEQDIDEQLEACLAEENYDEAALLCILKEIASKEDDAFSEHLRIILLSASTSLSNQELESASMRFQICYKLMEWRIQEVGKEYNVFLMTDKESVNVGPMVKISNWLKGYCGLTIVNSDEDISGGEQWPNSLMKFCETSTSVLVILKDPKIDYVVEYVTTAIISLEPEIRPKLVILKNKNVKLPPLWVNEPTVLLPDDVENASISSISAFVSSVFESIIG